MLKEKKQASRLTWEGCKCWHGGHWIENAEDRKHVVRTFQVNEWINEMVSERLQLNLSWGRRRVFPEIWKFCNKGKTPALNAAEKLVFKENYNTCVWRDESLEKSYWTWQASEENSSGLWLLNEHAEHLLGIIMIISACWPVGCASVSNSGLLCLASFTYGLWKIWLLQWVKCQVFQGCLHAIW